jgi:hypothetical protein
MKYGYTALIASSLFVAGCDNKSSAPEATDSNPPAAVVSPAGGASTQPQASATPEQAAPWWQWKSGLDGRIVCAQTMTGNWTKVGGPFKSDCRTPY